MTTAKCCARGLLGLALLMLAGPATSQGFPSKPVRVVLPYGTIGLPDILSRLVALKISDSSGQPVIVDNKPGAGGIIAYQFVAKAPPDGHTILLAADADYAITPALHAKLPYDPARDFTPVTQAIRGTYFLVANSALGVNSVQELIALAKARPGINYGSPGSGQTHHLAMAQLAIMAGVELTHVPYKGVAQATPALLSGDVSVMFVTLPSVVSHVKAGKLRILAAGSSQRSPLMPDVPTVAESGLAEFEVGISMGFVVHAATPRALVEQLNAEIVKALKSSDTESRLVGLGMEMVAGTPEQFADKIRRDQAHYGKLVRQIGLKID